MTIPRDAISLDNFERQERGLPPRKNAQVSRPEPEPPEVEGQVKLEDIPNGEIKDFSARSRSVRNEQGMRFTGFDVYIQFSDKTEVSGWILEGPFQQLKARIPKERIDLLQKIVV